jgi:hypothetical protein
VKNDLYEDYGWKTEAGAFAQLSAIAVMIRGLTFEENKVGSYLPIQVSEWEECGLRKAVEV